ncbi:MAG: histidine kinase dimerization/phospho-acceptor domain-containing protein, partial [Stellaceae bacterium]
MAILAPSDPASELRPLATPRYRVAVISRSVEIGRPAEAEPRDAAPDWPETPEELRRAIGDLMAVSILPTRWIADDTQPITESVAEVLVVMLGLEFAFVSLGADGGSGPPVVRARDPLAADQTERIVAAVSGWLIEPIAKRAASFDNPTGGGRVRMALQTIGAADHGTIVAGSRHPKFPLPTQRLLLEAAANQAAVALERRQAALALRLLNETLEQRVAAEISERLKLEEAFRQAQKMEAIGQLTGGIAHDFNNLLTAVLGSLEMLERHVTSPQGIKLLRTASRAADRGAELTENLLAFSRKQRLSPQAVDLNRVVANSRDMVERSVGPNIRIDTVLTPDLRPALVDPIQIELAILNLAINARDAMPQGGRLTFST